MPIPEHITLYKLMILYMLGKVDFSLSYTHISDFILENGYTDYMHLQPAISELLEDHLIHAETVRATTYYMITPEGEETNGYFQNRISPEIRADIDKWLKDNRLAMIDDISVVADYEKCLSGDYEVRCRIREKQASLCDLRLTVTDADMAEEVCGKWQEKSQQIYEYLVHELM